MLRPDGDGRVRVGRADIADGRLHRYGVDVGGVVIRFLLKKSGDRTVPVLDACRVCGAHGYAEVKGRLVCLFCAADINPATLGAGGGCNPVPLPYTDEGGAIVVSVEDLRRESPVFRKALGEQTQP